MDSIDSILDSAIRSYSDRNAPCGLEAGVLNRVERHSRRLRWWACAALAFAAIMLLPLLIQRPRVHDLPVRAVLVTPAAQPVTTGLSVTHQCLRRAPRIDSPETALMKFTRDNPREARHLLAAQELSEIGIEPLDIRELQ